MLNTISVDTNMVITAIALFFLILIIRAAKKEADESKTRTFDIYEIGPHGKMFASITDVERAKKYSSDGYVVIERRV